MKAPYIQLDHSDINCNSKEKKEIDQLRIRTHIWLQEEKTKKTHGSNQYAPTVQPISFFFFIWNEGPAYLCLLVKVRVHKQMMHDSPHHSTHGGNQYGSTYLNLILRVKHEWKTVWSFEALTTAYKPFLFYSKRI